MKIVIHFGLHKTASSSFQTFLYLNRAALQDVGVFYPKIENDKSHFQIPSGIIKNDWDFVKNFLNKAFKEASNNKIKTVFISSEDFETILIENYRANQFEQLAYEVGFSEVHWVGVLRSQWDYFNSLYAQLSSDGASLNYSAMGHDIIHYGYISIGTGTFRWQFAFDYDLFFDGFLENISGSLSLYTFDSFVENEFIGDKIINSIIDDKNLEIIFWESIINQVNKANPRIDSTTVEINYLANFLGIKMSNEFYSQNQKIFGPLVEYRQSLIGPAREELHKKFLERFPIISNKV